MLCRLPHHVLRVPVVAAAGSSTRVAPPGEVA
jgi:hypothetical protein